MSTTDADRAAWNQLDSFAKSNSEASVALILLKAALETGDVGEVKYHAESLAAYHSQAHPISGRGPGELLDRLQRDGV